VGRRPLTGFLVIALGLSWLLFAIPVLAFHGIIPGANLPVEVFALGSTLLILLPTALWVTSITDGRAGLRVLLSRVFRWRFGIGWWLVVLFGLPVIALLLGLIFGGSLHTADLGPACRRCTDGVGRRLAAVATSWHIRQTTYTASRFLC
jgi:uncharacterized protein